VDTLAWGSPILMLKKKQSISYTIHYTFSQYNTERLLPYHYNCVEIKTATVTIDKYTNYNYKTKHSRLRHN